MQSEWKITTLGEEVDFLTGFPFKSKEYTDDPNDTRLLRGDNIAQGFVRWSNAKRWPRDDAKSFEAYELREKDVVLAMDRPWIDAGLKYAAILEKDVPSLLLQRTSRLRGGKDLNSGFLRYLIGSPEFTRYIQSITTGSLVPHISSVQIKDYSFRKPPLQTQKLIASVLGSLDAKIELNHRINVELEGMAKLLYDYWFVQFDFPMSAAQAAAIAKPRLTGQPYQSSGGKMTYHPDLKREIPDGWDAGTLKDLFDLNPSVSIKKGQMAAYLDMNALPTSGFMTKAIQRKEFNGGTKFTNGDVLVARITPCLENGKTGLVCLLDEDELAFGSTEFIVLRGKELPLIAHACCLSRSEPFRNYAVRNMTGTSGRKRLEAPILEKLPIAIPPIETLSTFEQTCGSFFQLMTEHTQQNQHLTALRDWLLPMLMNGQVTVR